jgi:hypothetical protein
MLIAKLGGTWVMGKKGKEKRKKKKEMGGWGFVGGGEEGQSLASTRVEAIPPNSPLM